MPSFWLKVINPKLPRGTVHANVKWSEWPHVSVPDEMPTASQMVRFDDMPERGKFTLYALNGQGSFVGGYASPVIVVREGGMYIWDMTANIITREGILAEDEDRSQVGRWTPSELTPNATLTWAKSNPVKTVAYAVGGYTIAKRATKPRRRRRRKDLRW